jgi:glycosyltransferase involved in cell wall biosynthesis
MSNRIFIVVFDFLPFVSSFGATQRALFMARHLVRSGERVTVVCARGEFVSDFGVDVAAEPYEVVPVGSVVARWRSSGSLKAKAAGKGGGGGSSGALSSVKRMVKAALPLDYSLASFASFLKMLLQRVRPGDVVLVSGPPHGLMIAGAALRGFRDCFLVLDYRDAWTSGDLFRPQLVPSAKIAEHVERWCLQRADMVTYASGAFPRLMSERLGIDLSDKGVLVRNGWVQAQGQSRAPAKQSSAIRLAYFGIANDWPGHYRNLTPIIESIRDGLTTGRLEFHFFGEFVASEQTRKMLPPGFQYHGEIRASDVVATARDFDCLVMTHLDYKSAAEVVPAKFYDYMFAGKPVWCVAPRNGEVSRLIEQYGGGLVVPPDELSRVESKLEHLVQTQQQWRCSQAEVAQFSRDAQFRVLLSELRSRVGRAGVAARREQA